MNSRILPFNKTLIRKDWKLIRPISYIAMIILFFALPMHNLRILNYFEEGYYAHLEDLTLFYAEFLRPLQFADGPNILAVIIPFILAILLFGEERRKKTLEFLTVLPFSRYEIFLNKIMTGIIALVLPFLTNGLIMLLMRLTNEHINKGYTFNDVLSWFVASIVVSIAIFSFVVFFGTLTGTSIAQTILGFIFLFFPVGFASLIFANLDLLKININFSYAFLDKFLLGITLPWYATSDFFHSGNIVLKIIGLSIFSLITLFISKILFDKNALEYDEEILMFNNLETFLKAGVSFCTMLLIGAILPFIIYEHIIVQIIGYIIGGCLGWYIPNYFIKAKKLAN